MSALLRQMLQDAPAGLWPLDETSGTTAFDRSGFARNGTYVGSPTLGVATMLGRAVDLNGSTQYVDLGDNAAWSASDFTAEVWVQQDTVASEMVFIGKFGNGGSLAEWLLWAGATAALADIYNNTANDYLRYQHAQTPPAPAGVMTQWAITGTSAQVTLWRNAVALGTDTTVNNTPRQGDTTAPMLVGRRGLSGDERPLDGKAAYAAYFGSVLSADRIKAHYQAGSRAGVAVG